MKTGLKQISLLFISIVMIMSTIVISPSKVVRADSKEYTIKVNLGTNCTTIYKGKKAVKAMICSPSSETPTGTFYIPVKYRWHEMIGNCYAQYCSRITTGILFHSVWYYKNGDKSTMSVSAYNVMGNKASHGCVRLLCKDAKWIYDHCAVGTKVVIFWGDKGDDPIKRPGFTPIRNGKFMDWDPTDPDFKNPYRKKIPIITAKDKNVEFGSKVKPLDLVEIRDSAGNLITKANKNGAVKVKGKINTNKLGTYKITYKVKDSLKKKKTKTIKFKVIDTKKPKLKGVKNKKNIAMGTSVNLLSNVKAVSRTGIDITSKVKISVKYKGKKVSAKKGIIIFKNKGTYKVTYTVTGKNKQTVTKKVNYQVTDQRVKFTLKANTVTINQNEKFDFKNYVNKLTTYDGKNLDVAKNVKCIGNVDTTKAGTYVVTYTAKDGNKEYTEQSLKLTVVVKEVSTPQAPQETQKPQESETTRGPQEVETVGRPEEETTAVTITGDNANEEEGWTDLH